MIKKIFSVAFSLALLSSAAASAATLTSTFHVTANLVIPSGCTAFNTTDIAFGTITAVSQNGAWVTPQTESQGAITVNCTNNLPYTISLTGGNNPTNAGPNTQSGSRAMSNGAALLPYDIDMPNGCVGLSGSCSGANATISSCNDAGQFRWGYPGTAAYNQGTLSFTGTGSTQSIAECGYIYANTPAPAAGAYSDTVVATLTF